MSIAKIWGVSPEELAVPFPCDEHLEDPGAVYYRGVTVEAAPHYVYRWICQLRFAPYSYDWIDFMGKRSPRKLIPHAAELQVGQEILIGFKIVAFEPNRHVTFIGGPKHIRVFGQMAATYMVEPTKEKTSRLLVKMRARYPRGPQGFLLHHMLPWGDLFMMRKQLFTLRDLSEATQQGKIELPKGERVLEAGPSAHGLESPSRSA